MKHYDEITGLTYDVPDDYVHETTFMIIETASKQVMGCFNYGVAVG